jgi:hypothetical protein
MNQCRRCGINHDNGTILCDKHRKDKQKYDKKYSDKPEIKEKRSKSRIIRRRISNMPSEEKQLYAKQERQLYDLLIESISKLPDSRPQT